MDQTIRELSGDAGLRDRGLRVWAVNAGDDADNIRKFVAEKKYTFNVLLNSNKVAAGLYPLCGIPTTYLVGRDGRVRKSFSGFDAKIDRQLRDEIEAALK